MNVVKRVKTLFLLSIVILSACSKSGDEPSIKSEEQISSKDSVLLPAEQVSQGQDRLQHESKASPDSTLKTDQTAEITSYKTVEWPDLMPKEDLDALLSPPEYINEIEDGSMEDQIASQMKNALANATDDRYQQALVSTQIIPEMDGQAIRIPGFIVPIEFDDDEVITQFFLVPFFGACLHLPPPPPNQIILVDAPQGLKLQALYDPFWISGLLRTSITENEMATSAYSMLMMSWEEYTEEESE